MRAMILFTGYIGARLEEGCALDWPGPTSPVPR